MLWSRSPRLNETATVQVGMMNARMVVDDAREKEMDRERRRSNESFESYLVGGARGRGELTIHRAAPPALAVRAARRGIFSIFGQEATVDMTESSGQGTLASHMETLKSSLFCHADQTDVC